MDKNTAQLNLQFTSQPFVASTPGVGVAYVVGFTEKGPTFDPSTLISSWQAFQRLFGGENAKTTFATQVKHLLSAGGKVRVSRVTPSNATRTSFGALTSGANSLATFKAKYPGAYYNSVVIEAKAPSNGLAGFFDLVVSGPELGGNSKVVILEHYKNLPVPIGGDPNPTFLDPVIQSSKYIEVTYGDLSGFTGPIPIDYSTMAGSGGSDGTFPMSALIYASGFSFFDDYDDGWILAVPGANDADLGILASFAKSYVDGRGDLVFLGAIPFDESSTGDDAQNFLTELAISSENVGMIVGHSKALGYDGNPQTMDGLGDVVGRILYTHNTKGVWISPTNFDNGRLVNSLGPVYNYGPPSKLVERNQIANAGGNCIIQKQNTVMLWDFYSMADGSLPEKFLTVVFLKQYLKRTLVPYLEKFLNKPNTFATWRNIWGGVTPFLNSLVAKGAFFSYEWQGDQFATSLDDLQVNVKEDVLAGKYKAILSTTLVTPMVEFNLEIGLNTQTQTVSIG